MKACCRHWVKIKLSALTVVSDFVCAEKVARSQVADLLDAYRASCRSLRPTVRYEDEEKSLHRRLSLATGEVAAVRAA